MPLTAKGEKILSHLEEEYGAEKAERVLYAGKNKGTFTGIDAMLDAVEKEIPAGGVYNREAVEKAIEQAERRGGKVGGEERRLIHALLKGRGDARAMMDAVEGLQRRMDACDSRAAYWARQKQ